VDQPNKSAESIAPNPVTIPTQIAMSESRNSPIGGRESDSLVTSLIWQNRPAF
jgi:hypothetical protein